jgi:hypothetical protein
LEVDGVESPYFNYGVQYKSDTESDKGVWRRIIQADSGYRNSEKGISRVDPD